MFSIPRVNVIESDEGFSVEVLGRTGIKYQERDKVLLVDSEVLAPGKGIAIFTRSIKAWAPPHSEPITAEKRASIVANIKAAIEFRKQLIEIC